MQTLVTDSAREAANILKSGRVVAFPTETVYGLGASIYHADAIRQLFRAKGRPGDNPLIVHIYSVQQLNEVATEINDAANTLIEHFFPGPLTLVVKKNICVPASVTAGLDTVGVRCPANPIAREFLLHCGCPVAAPSANLSGLPSATSWETVFEDLNGKIDCVLRGEASSIGLESTIVDCSGALPVLLRAGSITFEQLQTVVPEITASGVMNKENPPKSPGLKYPHYAPKATILLWRNGEKRVAEPRSAYIGLSAPPKDILLLKVCDSLEAYGRELFSFFRLCDAKGIKVIYCELPSNQGLGRAIRDRILRASGENSECEETSQSV